MATIKNEDDLRTWLKTQPNHVARVIASRAALSAIPYLAAHVAVHPPARAAAIVLPCFRANAPPWFAGTWPNQGGEELAAAGDAAWARVTADVNSINDRM